MNPFRTIIFILASFVSFQSLAVLYAYDASEDPHTYDITTDAGFTEVLRQYVNLKKTSWQLGDLLFNMDGSKVTTRIHTSVSTTGWLEATPAQHAAAREDGLVVLNISPAIIAYFNLSTGSGGGNCLAPVPDCNAEQEPLIIDLGQDGIHLGKAGQGIAYDFFGSGDLVATQWVAPQGNDAFLALDKNHNGKIDNGAELFGLGILIETNVRAANGFDELAQYDQGYLGGNEDGVISAEDAVWTELILWLDSNANGVSSADELLKLEDFGIKTFAIEGKENGCRDPAGNLLRFWAWGTGSDANGNNKFKMVDVYFRALGTH